MPTDVTCETEIARPADVVAPWVFDTDHFPQWIADISRSERTPAGPIALGSRVKIWIKFLGKAFTYTVEVRVLEPMSMVTELVEGPFPMRFSYRIDPRPRGCLVAVRVQGEASGFFRVAAPLLPMMVRRGLSRDLETLKRRCERSA